MSDSFSKATCSFKTCDNEDGSFWISANPEGPPLKLSGRVIEVGLDLKPGTPMKEADDLAATLERYVAHVRLWQD
jgi:hypothetical protein